MQAGDSFRFDRDRHLAAAELRPAHYADFQRLVKDLRYGGAFQILVAEFNDVPYRDALIARLDSVLADAGIAHARLVLSSDAHPDFAAAESALRALSEGHRAIHVLGGETWFDDQRWEAFNIRREAVARNVPVRLMLWLTAEPIGRLAIRAPDLWAWRGGIFSFSTETQPPQELPSARRGPIDSRSLAERGRRIGELRGHLAAEPPLPEDLRLPLLDELAGLLESLGELDEALRIRREEELPVYERLGDVRGRAVTLGKIADVLQAQGELDEALRIYRTEVLPAFERLGDVRERAVTLRKIADILIVRGELDEGVTLLNQAVELITPLGAIRDIAVFRGQIADVLAARGELDEALRIRREEQLPVFERLGDVRARAVTLGKIADVLQARGELDEALRIYREEELPVYERLGDVRERAGTLGRIADVLQARGELDEALRIRREEELPVYERLGDVRERAVTLGRIADVLQARGELDEALRIRREEQLPVYERLGDVRSRAIVLAKLGMALAQKGDKAAAVELLSRALRDAQRLQLREAGQIRQIMQDLGLQPED